MRLPATLNQFRRTLFAQPSPVGSTLGTMLKQQQELREHPHFPINAGGRIIFADGEATVRCRVWDMSENAALLLLTDKDWRVPNTFQLLIDDTVRHVWVLWRRGDTLGVVWDLELPPHIELAELSAD
jgi:hypothetical protein